MSDALRTEFEQTLRQLANAEEAYSHLTESRSTHHLVIEWHERIEQLWREHAPKSKRKKPLPRRGLPDEHGVQAIDLLEVSSAVGAEVFNAGVKDLQEKAAQLIAAWRLDCDLLRKQLQMLAVNLVPRAGDQWHTVRSFYAGAYSSQGSSADRYAEQRALLDVAHVGPFGIEVRATHSNGSVHAQAKVASEVDARIIEYLPRIELVTFVQLCWKRGVNPRVYYPMLPHGFEEKNGLDFFGGWLKAKQKDGR